MKAIFCTRGALREHLLADKQVPVKPYAPSPTAKEAFISHAERWYRAMTENHHYEVEKDI
jgi:hypothetical protein